MRVSVEVVLALVLIVLIRLFGGPFYFRNHPVLGPFFKLNFSGAGTCCFLKTGWRPKSFVGVHLLVSASFSILSSNYKNEREKEGNKKKTQAVRR